MANFLGYTVQKMEGESRFAGYILTGPRGATYGLIRSQNDQSLMFATNSNGNVCGLKGNYWFTDRNGSLETA